MPLLHTLPKILKQILFVTVSANIFNCLCVTNRRCEAAAVKAINAVQAIHSKNAMYTTPQGVINTKGGTAYEVFLKCSRCTVMTFNTCLKDGSPAVRRTRTASRHR
jgi:hypothetical protein